MLGSHSAFAMDVDEHCTVNIMNRTVQVQSDGSWRMDNVPSFMGRVRARATCVNDGVTTSGQSEFFTLNNNNLSVVEGIFFDDPAAIPVSLNFDNEDNLSLSSDQLTTQLSVRAAFSDGSFSPELNASNGINFTSSNPAIISVDENGGLQANSSDRVLITARLEGAVASILVTAALSGDMDGDGLPDSYEVANGLDPNDPVDAFEDRDGDGITDNEELVAGVDGFITNPLLADTDGDGFFDGLEIDLATDPTDNLSFDLPNALESITVSPETLKLVFNGVDTEVSDSISVTGHLIDGGTIDITSSSLGTTYNSADLSIASFGTTDGEIFGGTGGTTTITASNNGYSDTITVEVERFNPVALSAIDIPGYANNVDVQGNYAYVAAGSAGLVIIDVTDRSAPLIIGQLDTDGTAIDVKVSGNLVYLADGEAGIKIIDASDPSSPVLRSSLDTRGFARDIDFNFQHLYVADDEGGLFIINIVDPDNPFLVTMVSDLGKLKGVSVEGSRLAMIATSELLLMDVSDVRSLNILSRTPLSQPKDVLVQNSYAYIPMAGSGYRVFNIIDLSAPVESAVDGNINPRDVVIRDGLVLFTDQSFSNAVAYMNGADPNNIVFQGIIDFTPLNTGFGGTGIAADNQYVYTTKQMSGPTNDYSLEGITKLFIGQYRRVTDERGQAPSVNIVQPTAYRLYCTRLYDCCANRCPR
ncbi:hypothetical protein AB835_09635 [Candidatus Endobugula sertula]|uniref:BIG2 domain-containing protein n=1 Tax=Candidatus Endobugula sertula TaxID=62101 RepID=A0A1D2QNW5_9GAMM|nr:hypothetical protein AB835_09635 [Candidatus Endobugula sertula]